MPPEVPSSEAAVPATPVPDTPVPAPVPPTPVPAPVPPTPVPAPVPPTPVPATPVPPTPVPASPAQAAATPVPPGAPVPPDSPVPAEAPARRRRRPRRLLVTLTVLALALAAAGTALALRESGGKGGDGPGSGSGESAAGRRVADATGELRLTVPAAWAREYADGGWDPAAIGLPAAKEPGLTVATKVADWSDPDSGVDGVFAGAVDLGAKRDAAPLTAAVEALRHDGCRKPSEEEWDAGEWKGVVRTWTGCSRHRLAEAALAPRKDGDGRGAYVQIRCARDGSDCEETTKKVLSGLELAPAGKSTERP
ncbi:PE-PGRS family protein [Streptomyces sp. SPB074]|nr:PE-PGRS family protein [Streptomyces sp. SPB074]